MYSTDYSNYKLTPINCPVCGTSGYKVLGIRGNREYYRANQSAEPHVYTNVVRCLKCDFIYTNPMITGLEFLEMDHYNSPEEYQAANSATIEAMFNKRLDLIEKYLKGKVSLLDIGAGKGEFLHEATKRKWEVEGVEPSPNFCAFAKEKYGLTIHQGYLGQDVQLKKKYTLITLNHVLEHIDAPYDFLQNIKNYMDPHGLMYIEVPNSDSWVLRMADLVFRLKGKNWSSRLSPLHPPFHKYGYTKKSLRYILENNGYTVLNMQTFEGKERGYKNQKWSVLIMLRNVLSSFTNLLGNRELLYTIVKLKTI